MDSLVALGIGVGLVAYVATVAVVLVLRSRRRRQRQERLAAAFDRARSGRAGHNPDVLYGDAAWRTMTVR